MIKLENISKIYRIYNNPSDRFKEFLKPFYEKISFIKKKNNYRDFSAINNISFSLDRGKSLGVIGRNGAGKSTLLQIIAGTLTPTSGKISVNGRINALLELGSGFNPEFTGKENIYLNASILGFTTKEIDKKYDEIVDFSEIGEFIHQPVKTYSSGMFVKLAFSVQALLNPEILIVDEALSVGDIFFQKKCAIMFEKLISSGTTLLFVSHDMTSIIKYCEKTILLDQGEILYYGDSTRAVNLYFSLSRMSRDEVKKEILINEKKRINNIINSYSNSKHKHFNFKYNKITYGSFSKFKNIGFLLYNKFNESTDNFYVQDKCKFSFLIEPFEEIECPIINLSIFNKKNVPLFGNYSYQFPNTKIPDLLSKNKRLIVEINLQLDIYPDEYIFNLGIGTMKKIDLNNIESLTLFEYEEKYTHLITLEISSFKVNSPKKGLYLPFTGLTNLPGKCRYKIL